MDWFELAFGFKEEPNVLYERDNQHLSVQYYGHDDPQNRSDTATQAMQECPTLTCKKSGKIFHCGFFSTPSLADLRLRNTGRLSIDSNTKDDSNPILNLRSNKNDSKLKLTVEIGDAAALHKKYPFSTVQVASQLNCLEFVSPKGNPERGVRHYAMDHTQGPACCLCTAPAIAYRNYYHPYTYDDQVVFGQTKDKQWNNLKDIEKKLGNENGKYWTVQGGYTMTKKESLEKIPWDSHNVDELKSLLRVGIHADTQITSHGNWGMMKNNTDKDNLITHVLCSACAIGYNGFGVKPWEKLAKLLLQACYEATLYAGLENYYRHGGKHQHSNKIFLTLVGGGVFGNPSSWIYEAIEKACIMFQHTPLDVRIVAFCQPDQSLLLLVDRINKTIALKK